MSPFYVAFHLKTTTRTMAPSVSARTIDPVDVCLWWMYGTWRDCYVPFFAPCAHNCCITTRECICRSWHCCCGRLTWSCCKSWRCATQSNSSQQGRTRACDRPVRRVLTLVDGASLCATYKTTVPYVQRDMKQEILYQQVKDEPCLNKQRRRCRLTAPNQRSKLNRLEEEEECSAIRIHRLDIVSC
jgi:hypothetical protein